MPQREYSADNRERNSEFNDPPLSAIPPGMSLVSPRSRAPDSKLTIVLPSIKYSIRNFTKLIRG